MTSPSISPSNLGTEIAGKVPPILIDVRRRSAFLEADAMVCGALRREPQDVRGGGQTLPRAGAVVVYCVHGREVSQTTAAALNDAGISTRYLEGGLEGWKEADGQLDHKPRASATRWVTRERPKIDRIACPWLIARFVDP